MEKRPTVSEMIQWLKQFPGDAEVIPESGTGDIYVFSKTVTGQSLGRMTRNGVPYPRPKK